MAFNGPYFNDPVLDWESFKKKYIKNDLNNPHRGIIIHSNQPVGEVFAYWEDGKLEHWLEIGILIYHQNSWGNGLGTEALKLWLAYLFELHPHLQRIGYTTWSGNQAMMMVGEKIGMTREATIRQVRYYQDQYFDSVKYGILREELDLLK